MNIDRQVLLSRVHLAPTRVWDGGAVGYELVLSSIEFTVDPVLSEIRRLRADICWDTALKPDLCLDLSPSEAALEEEHR